MKVSYNKLWKLLIDKNLKKKDLMEQTGISKYTINRLKNGENVNVDTLIKICTVLDCTLNDIMELVTIGGEN